MYVRIVAAAVLLVISTGAGLAQQSTTRIDLSGPFRSFRGITFIFEDSNADCPELVHTVSVLNGILRIHSHQFPPIEQPLIPTRMKFDPVDDSTYRLQFAKVNCRIDIDIRQQIRSGEEWASLLVLKERRPSLSDEERRELQKRRADDLRKQADASAQQNPRSPSEIGEILWGKGPRRWGSTISTGFGFDEAPKSCVDAFGEYRVTRSSFAMAFFAPLPGNLNTFILEGRDLDPSHARIYLTKDDCRFEFTISQSIQRDRQWIALPLRPVPEDTAIK